MKLPNRGWLGLPTMSQYMYQDTYFIPGEDYEGWVHRMASTYSHSPAQATRIASYIHNYWFHPSTPISSNGGTDRGLPISCYVGDVEDSKDGIFASWMESCYLGAGAGGIGRDWSSVREMGSPISNIGKSSGIIPFMCVDGALTRAVSQGGVRRMSQADYLDISHPEITEFIDIRRPTGDQNRRDQDLHHGISISDAFMQAVISGSDWNLVSPHTGKTINTVPARELWTHILELKATTGEPYLFFYDNVNRLSPPEYKTEGLDIHLSNLCTEIMLNTSPTKTNVCCLASLNLEYFDEYKADLDTVVADCTDFLDAVLQDFIDRTEGKPGFARARTAAIDERALGLGVMGFHGYLQQKLIPFESAIARSINMSIFKAIRASADKHQATLAPCPMSVRCGTNRRNIVTLAIAPTMSISNLCNLASSGIEPNISNAFSKKLKQGTFAIQNRYLDKVIMNYFDQTEGLSHDWPSQQWASIKKFDGSVQHLDWMDQDTKDVFKTAFELDQRWLLQHAADRTPFIDQGQSLNLFVPGNSHVQYLSDLHILAWKLGIKSLYYLRSTNPNKASSASTERKSITSGTDPFAETCLGCQ